MTWKPFYICQENPLVVKWFLLTKGLQCLALMFPLFLAVEQIVELQVICDTIVLCDITLMIHASKANILLFILICCSPNTTPDSTNISLVPCALCVPLNISYFWNCLNSYVHLWNVILIHTFRPCAIIYVMHIYLVMCQMPDYASITVLQPTLLGPWGFSVGGGRGLF